MQYRVFKNELRDRKPADECDSNKFFLNNALLHWLPLIGVTILLKPPLLFKNSSQDNIIILKYYRAIVSTSLSGHILRARFGIANNIIVIYPTCLYSSRNETSVGFKRTTTWAYWAMSDDLRLYCTLRNNLVLNFKCVVCKSWTLVRVNSPVLQSKCF